MPTTNRLISKLKAVAGKSAFLKDPIKIESYAIDGKRPKGVVLPKTVEEVSRIVAYANGHCLAIVPVGNGTKTALGGAPERLDLVLRTARLNRIIDCDVENLTLTAESGITLSEVQRHLAKEGKGYFVPLDPPFTERATLGGIVASNSSGPKRLLYGTARDLVIGMKVVFPNGDIVVAGGKTVKNVSGYDMCKLLVGSFGTLGIICEVTLRLLPLPEAEASLLLPFRSVEEADSFVQELSRSHLLPAAVETLNALAVKELKYVLRWPSEANYLVAIAIEGVKETTGRQVVDIGNMGKRRGALEAIPLQSEGHSAFWTALREVQTGLTEKYSGSVVLKSNFLISKCGGMITCHEKTAQELGLECALISHSLTGILYTYVLRREEGPLGMESLIRFIRKLTLEAVKNEGNTIIESSPLFVKRRISPWGKSRRDLVVMRRIKKEIDPRRIFSPGRFVGGI